MDSINEQIEARFDGLQEVIINEHQKMVEGLKHCFQLIMRIFLSRAGAAELLHEQQEEFAKEKAELKEENSVSDKISTIFSDGFVFLVEIDRRSSAASSQKQRAARNQQGCPSEL